MPQHKVQVVNEIFRSLDAGELSPGDNISEQDLMDKLGVSKTPVREALIELDAQGYIVRAPRKGASVFKPTLEELLVISEVNARLHGMATGLAARRLSDGRKRELIAATQACMDHALTYGDDRPDEFFNLNYNYHKVIVESALNDYLYHLIVNSSRKILAYYRIRHNFPGNSIRAARDHEQITALMLDKDFDGAERLIIEHSTIDSVEALDLMGSIH